MFCTGEARLGQVRERTQQRSGWRLFLSGAEALQSRAQHERLYSRLGFAPDASVLPPNCRAKEQACYSCSSSKPERKSFLTSSAKGLTPSHNENTSLPQIHLSFHCALEVHLLISVVVVVVKKHVSRQWAL